jgi:uroporphyrinogen-III synthase
MNVLITRPIDQSINLINMLSKNKFTPFVLPLIEITPIPFQLDKIDFDYIIFTSQNTCKYFINHLRYFDLNRTQIIAIGPKTADFLRNKNISVNIIPKEHSSEGIKKLFLDQNIRNKKILIPGSQIRDRNLENFLVQNNNYVESLDIYTTNSINYDEKFIDNLIKEFAIEVITLFSPSAAKALLKQFSYNKYAFITYICIGNKTADYLKQNGLNPLFPGNFTEDALIQLLINLKTEGFDEISRNKTKKT